MPVWHTTLYLKDLLSGDVSPEHARATAANVARRLKSSRRLPDAYRDGDVLAIIEEFEDLADSEDGDTADFNAILSALYDWADYRRVWIA